MSAPLNASATTAGTLMSTMTFEIPQYQREYAWKRGEVEEFWNDLAAAAATGSYFLGLVILMDGERKHVVDGQQRLLTLTLLSAALYHQALEAGRTALAERIQSHFLRSIDFDTDETFPRLVLSDEAADATLRTILERGATELAASPRTDDSSARLVDTYKYLDSQLRADSADEPFRRLGVWTEFLTNRLHFAVFMHPDAASAYQVFEVVNTRGKQLTTADLLKNYVLSTTPPERRDGRYNQWQQISGQFSEVGGASTFVQYIRHVINLDAGYILPKDLYNYLSGRSAEASSTKPPSVDSLMSMLEDYLPLYLQIVDPTLDGPAGLDELAVFEALKELNVTAIRPLLLAIARTPQPASAMKDVLKLVVRRIVVGNLGTGSIERKFADTAKRVQASSHWDPHDLAELSESREDFESRLANRSYNKNVLTFLRRSILARTITPEPVGILHYLRPRQAPQWSSFGDEDTFWVSTIGNVLLADVERRPRGANTWQGVKSSLLPTAVDNEWTDVLKAYPHWSRESVETVGTQLAEAAARVWY